MAPGAARSGDLPARIAHAPAPAPPFAPHEVTRRRGDRSSAADDRLAGREAVLAAMPVETGKPALAEGTHHFAEVLKLAGCAGGRRLCTPEPNRRDRRSRPACLPSH
jgi:hypothetical protein